MSLSSERSDALIDREWFVVVTERSDMRKNRSTHGEAAITAFGEWLKKPLVAELAECWFNGLQCCKLVLLPYILMLISLLWSFLYEFREADVLGYGTEIDGLRPRPVR
jgi:hypothetical protein